MADDIRNTAGTASLGLNPSLETPLTEKSTSEKIWTEDELKTKSFGWLLLNQQRYLFHLIDTNTRLELMIEYFLKYSALFTALFGMTLGFFALNLQIVFAAVKSVLLILGTMLICLPALFTFNVLLGSKLSMKQTFATLSMTSYLLSMTLVSFAPIMLFFIISTTSKDFVVLLTVVFFGISGIFGVKLLWSCMDYLTKKAGTKANLQIIRVWSVIYIFVGTQFAWILRPFIGDKGELAIFRMIEGNFYIAVLNHIGNIFRN
jgi:hypothetical protein